jgi:hypothetical protein
MKNVILKLRANPILKNKLEVKFRLLSICVQAKLPVDRAISDLRIKDTDSEIMKSILKGKRPTRHRRGAKRKMYTQTLKSFEDDGDMEQIIPLTKRQVNRW